ncbi:disease resistance protein RPV1-like isoform X1 [Vitis riparia]|uniref:disease resistance protein RPV1-like isoform X1 n=1 Tax=Vitis riparia TaxID=96939 RepID=UPI00155A312C|nr:disease resistance protein RPV1-like isoform X1 [Vitis riparia]
MASSTQTPSSSSSTPIRKYNFDVFLSFRGEDSGYNFTDQLYENLLRSTTKTFRDDELEKGEEIKSGILKTIEESKISIVVFSKNYAHSKWCLDEFAKIMECRKEMGQIVLPVFYHVDRPDVHVQRGSFGEAFCIHKRDVDEKKVQRWRDALTKAAYLSSFHVPKDGNESTIIEKIIDFVNRELKLPGHNLIGIDGRLEELKSLIGIGSYDVRMLGVWGLGGIGKTSIARVIYNSISYQFDGASFLPSVCEQSMPRVQKELLSDITELSYEELNVDEGLNKIKEELQKKKILIIVDDVDCLSQLKDLVPNRDCLGGGSRIIITTRDKHLLLEHGVDAIYEVQGLDFEESIRLFSLYAFKARFPKREYRGLSLNIVNYSEGLPLALKVLGGFLFGKSIYEWESILYKLKHQSLKEIQDVLQISYDRLDYKTKDIFLDIACFFKGEEREFVSRILDGAEKAITDLYNKSLLTFSNNKIMMHPLLQQMGQGVVHQACPQEPGKQSRLWRSEDVHRILRQNEGTDAIEGIVLKISAAERIAFTTKAFKMMNKLRLLKVCRDHKCGSMVHVSTDFEFPSYELRYLHWDGYPLESLPSNFHGEKLIELNLQNSELRGLWEGSKPLEKLKVINLSHSQQLIQIPDFSDTPNLESLILEGCTNLENIPSSIWDLDSLVNLDLSRCSKLQELAEIPWNLYSLEYLNLAFCTNLESLPESLSNLKCLKTLNVIGCSKLPDNLGSLECLEKLYASSSELISPQSDSSLAGLCSLKVLDVHGTNLEQGAIGSDIGSLYSLEELDLSYCNLTEGGIPDDICCLYSLRVLDLSGNHFLKVTDAISQLSKLRVLGLRHCKSLLEIPELPSSLRVLDAHDCISLETLSSTSLLQWQRQLNCFKSARLQEIQELKYRRLFSLPANGVSQGFNTVIPGGGEVPEWISHEGIGSEVTVKLPLNWYHKKDFLGFALCCVYIPQQDEPVDESMDEPESSKSENAMVNITQPYRLGCELSFLDDEIGFLDYLFCGSSCQCDHNDGVSESVWVTYYSNVAIKHKYRSHKSRHLKASFRGYVDGKPVKVKKCGIGLVHVDLNRTSHAFQAQHSTDQLRLKLVSHVS